MPQRSCIACRRVRPKRELVRLVRAAGGPATCHPERSEGSPGGVVEIDIEARKPGRGAYLCPERACWEKAVKSGLEKALRCRLTREDREMLLHNSQKMLKELMSGQGQ